MKSNLDVHLSKPGQLHFVQVHFTTDEVRPSSVKIFFSGTWRSSSVHNKDTVRDRTWTTREVVWSIHLTYCTSGETSLVHECLFVKKKNPTARLPHNRTCGVVSLVHKLIKCFSVDRQINLQCLEEDLLSYLLTDEQNEFSLCPAEDPRNLFPVRIRSVSVVYMYPHMYPRRSTRLDTYSDYSMFGGGQNLPRVEWVTRRWITYII
jgi:hypothetical protein